ncbi:MAG: fused MFS/spermidine synthase [Desulfococcaceae bacterium]
MRNHRGVISLSVPSPGSAAISLTDRSTMLSLFVALCFFISGAAGLVYELLWLRLIDKIIGSAPFAVSTVLSVFMAGMALGSYLAGRAADRFTSRAALLRVYGKLEMGIGICALTVPAAIGLLQPVYHALYDRLLTHFWCYQAAAFAGCTLVLLVPAALMGATMPILCRYYVLGLGHIGTRTGRLYGLNTAGAALGVLLCGFVLIRTLGVWMSLLLFAAVNIAVGLSCILLSRMPFAEDSTEQMQDTAKGKTAAFSMIYYKKPDFSEKSAFFCTYAMHSRSMQWGLGLFAVSGFCAMAYQVLWTRILGLVAGPTAYCFTLVVAAFIIGLALGSIFSGPLADKSENTLVWLAAAQIGAALAALAVSQFLGSSQFLFAKLIHAFEKDFSHLILAQSLLLFAVLLLPTLFMGAAFPLVNRICVPSIKHMGRSLGRAYALNTLGALSGSFVAGFVLIPWLGKENGLRLIIGIQFTAACLALMHTMMHTLPAKKRFALAGFFCAGLLLLSHYPCWRTDLLSRGWYRDFSAMETELERTSWTQALWKGSERIAGQRQGLEVVFQGEGVSGFTTVEKEINSLGTVEYAMFNSGKADASSHGDRSTQTLSAHIPMLFHPNAQNVMVLGLASGMTPGEVLLYPVKKLDIAEINEQVVKACKKFFSPFNNHCLDDPRTRLILQDGRNHLALTRESYDVIISEPSNPWMAGLANLYSLEFFQLARQRLTPGGFFAQWIQAYEMDWETFCLLGRTFAAVFPQGSLMKVGPVDYLLLGFTDPKGFDWQAAQRHLAFAQKSQNIVFPGTDFLVHLILTEDLEELFGSGPLHTDNMPRLEFAAPMKLSSGTLNIDRAAAGHRRLSAQTQRISDAADRMQSLLDLAEFAASAHVPMFNVLRWQKLNPAQQARYQSAVEDYCSRIPVPSYDIFSEPGLKICCAEVQISAIGRKISADDSHPIDHYNLGLALVAAERKSDALSSLHRAVSLDPDFEPAVLALGLVLAENGELDEAARFLSHAVSLGPGKAEPYKYLGMVELRRGAADMAANHLSAAWALAPDDPVILSELGIALMHQGKNRNAAFYLAKAVEHNPQDDESRYYLELARRNMEEEEQILTAQ